MKRENPKLKAVVIWGALLFGTLFWVTAAMIVIELVSLICAGF